MIMPRFPRALPVIALLAGVAAVLAASPPARAQGAAEEDAPDIRSMSVLEFLPDGTLLVGDSRAGAVWSLELPGEVARGEVESPIRVMDLEGKLGAMLGASADEVMIHDLAVHPLSKNQFLAVSRGRKAWTSEWHLPNDVADATILVRVSPEGEIDDVSLAGVPYRRAELPNPVDAEKTHPWKEGISLRADAITDLAFVPGEGDGGTVLVAGLSNEEFASTLWRLPYPFDGDAPPDHTTLEIYHGAHGEFETHAPIRTFLAYTEGDEQRLLASYLCTPLVTFRLDELEPGAHARGRTVAELGAGNAPYDMIRVRDGDRVTILMSNTSLPLLSFDPDDVARHPAITDRVPTYTYGVPYVARAGAGIQHIANYGETLVAMLQRTPSGRLDLTAMPVRYLRR
jgi:hypothetical protein